MVTNVNIFAVTIKITDKGDMMIKKLSKNGEEKQIQRIFWEYTTC